MSKWIRTDEIKKKMSVSHIGNSSYISRIGVPLSNERKKNISSSLKGRYVSPQHAKNIADSLRGKKKTDKHIHNAMIGQENASYKRKPYKLGEEIIMIQGYENLTLDKLINENIPVDKIKVKTSNKPRIQYQWNNKLHWYYPDCYLPETNTVVETKSDWTWKTDLDRNMSKLRASQNCGYNVRLIVWNGKKELVLDTSYSIGCII
jgi:hypothetical protein